MKKRIDDQFQREAQTLVASGKSKLQAAKVLGVCQRTVRRALAALAQAGSAHCVHSVDPSEFAYVEPAPRPVRPGEVCAALPEAMAREGRLMLALA